MGGVFGKLHFDRSSDQDFHTLLTRMSEALAHRWLGDTLDATASKGQPVPLGRVAPPVPFLNTFPPTPNR